MSGLQIVHLATETMGPFWSLTTSQIYSELKRLLEVGYIEQAEVRARSTRVYAVTDKGRAVFDEHINTMPGDETIRYPLLLFLQFGAHIKPELMEKILRTHRQRHQDELKRYEQCALNANDLSKYDEALVEFGKRYERMVLEWFDDILPRLRA